MDGINFRQGEATNPGPCEVKPGLVLGAFNPTGLMHKSAFLADLPTSEHAIWGVSETHLTQQGVQKFRAEMRFNKSEFSFYPGTPAPYRSSAPDALGGKQVGTGFLTSLPTRPIANAWPAEVTKTARLMTHTFRCYDQWLHGVVFYGPAKGAETAVVRAEADELLSNITQLIVFGLTGKRFIMGDFNQLDGLLTQTKVWSDLGWKEIQDMEYEATGKKPVPTCKNCSRKDFVWISPELQPFWQSTAVDTLAFKDHAVLSAQFKPLCKPCKIPLWRQPKPIPWNKIRGQMPEGSFKFTCVQPEKFCASLAGEFERRASNMCLQSFGNPLLDCQKGRSQTTETVQVLESQNPLRPGRHGDYTPEYHGTHMTHKRWFKQLRRMEAYARGTANQVQSTRSKTIHQTREWRAILNAPGFPGGFQTWWACRPHRYPGVPYDLPHSPLPGEQAQALCMTFEAEVRALEQVLIKEVKAKLQKAHAENPNKVFRDMQKPKVQPIQMLVDQARVQVEEVHPEELAFTFSTKATLEQDKPLITPHGPMQPIVITEDKVWVDNLHDLQPGDEVHQDTVIGDLPTLFERFGSEWASRWDKHRETPETFWDPVMSFIDTAIPQHAPMPYQKITAEQILQVIRRKKPSAATGADGWSRQDILHMAPDLVQSIADLYAWVEEGNKWPVTLVTGIIHSLEKRQDASQVQHYRPITVFSLIYRAWSSIRSRQILDFLTDQIPLKCFGNVPKKTAKDVWFGIQQQIEDHYYSGRPMTGCMLDLAKAFNHLPRLPIMKVGVKLGIPKPILHAWASALQTMERRFYIRGATGPALRSCSGLPEGCGMSVVGMLLINVISDKWVQLRAPKCSLWTYVDNIEVTASTRAEVQKGYDELTHILAMLELPIDDKKTIFWSTDQAERQSLRSSEQPTAYWTRDLGGHVQYSRQLTNSVITGKITEFQPRWQSLAASKAGYRKKMHAIKSVAWPNVLHGIASAFVGTTHFDELRTAALRSLGEHKPGVSPILHLSMVSHPSADPGFFAIWNTLLETRKYLTCEAASPILNDACRSFKTRPRPGPVNLLQQRMTQLHWAWDQHASFVDAFGQKVDIWDAPIQELLERASEAWQQQVAGQIAARKTFAGMQATHAKLTTRKLPTDSAEYSLLRTCLNGTFYTADHLHKRDENVSAACPFCGEDDSVTHRNWECRALEDARVEVPLTCVIRSSATLLQYIIMDGFPLPQPCGNTGTC